MADDADKAAVIELLNLYGLALDAHAWDLFDLIFAEDVEAEFGPAGNAWVGLENFKRSFAEFHATLDSHQHTMMGQLVHVDGDKANAFSYGNWLLIRSSAEDGPTWTGTGWYDDELVRTDAGLAHQAPGLPTDGLDRQPVRARAQRRAPSRHEAQRPAGARRRRQGRLPQRRPGSVAT